MVEKGIQMKAYDGKNKTHSSSHWRKCERVFFVAYELEENQGMIRSVVLHCNTLRVWVGEEGNTARFGWFELRCCWILAYVTIWPTPDCRSANSSLSLLFGEILSWAAFTLAMRRCQRSLDVGLNKDEIIQPNYRLLRVIFIFNRE